MQAPLAHLSKPQTNLAAKCRPRRDRWLASRQMKRDRDRNQAPVLAAQRDAVNELLGRASAGQRRVPSRLPTPSGSARPQSRQMTEQQEISRLLNRSPEPPHVAARHVASSPHRAHASERLEVSLRIMNNRTFRSPLKGVDSRALTSGRPLMSRASARVIMPLT